MISQDIPGYGVGFPACEAGHDSQHIPGDIDPASVALDGRAVEAVGSHGLHDDHDGRILLKAVGKISDDRTCKGPDASLDKDMGWTASILGKLLISFQGKGSVALHDPGRDLFIAFPCSILHHNAMFRILGFLGGHPHAVVIVEILDGYGGIFLCDIFKTGLGRAFRHSYHAFLAQLVGSPGNASSVIAVGRGKEGGLAEFFSQFFGSKHMIRNLAYILSQLLRDVSCDGVGTPQYFEGIQAKTARLVFDVQPFQAQVLRQIGKPGQRGHAILGKTLMKGVRLRHLFPRHIARLQVIRLRHGIECPF